VIRATILHVDVETMGELTVGETIVDTDHRNDGDPNVHFAFEADERGFVDLVLSIFALNAPMASPPRGDAGFAPGMLP
jgi:inosine-uridine nucleoside N-ribohydrolase